MASVPHGGPPSPPGRDSRASACRRPETPFVSSPWPKRSLAHSPQGNGSMSIERPLANSSGCPASDRLWRHESWRIARAPGHSAAPPDWGGSAASAPPRSSDWHHTSRSAGRPPMLVRVAYHPGFLSIAPANANWNGCPASGPPVRLPSSLFAIARGHFARPKGSWTSPASPDRSSSGFPGWSGSTDNPLPVGLSTERHPPCTRTQP